jgi:hypothetical protein
MNVAMHWALGGMSTNTVHKLCLLTAEMAKLDVLLLLTLRIGTCTLLEHRQVPPLGAFHQLGPADETVLVLLLPILVAHTISVI